MLSVVVAPSLEAGSPLNLSIQWRYVYSVSPMFTTLIQGYSWSKQLAMCVQYLIITSIQHMCPAGRSRSIIYLLITSILVNVSFAVKRHHHHDNSYKENI